VPVLLPARALFGKVKQHIDRLHAAREEALENAIDSKNSKLKPQQRKKRLAGLRRKTDELWWSWCFREFDLAGEALTQMEEMLARHGDGAGAAGAGARGSGAGAGAVLAKLKEGDSDDGDGDVDDELPLPVLHAASAAAGVLRQEQDTPSSPQWEFLLRQLFDRLVEPR
jgi:hypothetical protein